MWRATGWREAARVSVVRKSGEESGIAAITSQDIKMPPVQEESLERRYFLCLCYGLSSGDGQEAMPRRPGISLRLWISM